MLRASRRARCRLSKNAQRSEDESGLKELLDLVHLNQILRADAVLVVGDGYIGHSTAREILWASMQGKPVHYCTSIRGWGAVAKAVAEGHDNTELAVSAARQKLGLPID